MGMLQDKLDIFLWLGPFHSRTQR